GGDEPLEGNVLPAVGRRVDLREPRLPLLHRDGVLELAGRLFLRAPGTVVLAGPSGAGLTACALEALAGCLPRRAGDYPDFGQRVVRVDCPLVATDMPYPTSTDERLRRLLADCLADPDAWYFFDDVQWPLRAGLLAQAALSAAVQRGLRALCTFQTDT